MEILSLFQFNKLQVDNNFESAIAVFNNKQLVYFTF